jgi:hypothetical protein
LALTQEPLEKWQEALGHWPEWKNSIEKAQTYIRDKYGDIDELISEAKITLSPLDDSENPKTLPVISWNEAEEALTEASDEIQRMASAFIAKEIGI